MGSFELGLLLGSSGSETFSPLCSLGRFAEDRIVSGPAALAPRHRRKAPRALLPACKYPDSGNCPPFPPVFGPYKKCGTGHRGAQRMLANRASAGRSLGYVRTATIRRAPAAPSLVFFLTGPGPCGIRMRSEWRRSGGGGVGVIFAGAAERGRLATTLGSP